jgi:hypothetical protein
VKLVAYLDESGTSDRTGKQQGSEQIVVTGYLGWREDWNAFCGRWKSVLDNYGAAYFHFYEWAEASAVARGVHRATSNFATNPYKDWSLSKIDSFLLELAELAGCGAKMIIGGWISTRDFHEAKHNPDYAEFTPRHGDPYRECLIQFFANFSADV